jgi:uncharacterized protein YegL
MADPLEAGDPGSLGDFALRGRLRQDALWQVFEGTTTDGRLATVRLAHAGLARDRHFRRAFKDALGAVRSIDHPSVLRVIAHRVRAKGTWVATERPVGQSLADMTVGGQFPALQLAPLAAGLARALGAIHGGGLVHGDLHPANVFLQGGCRVDGFGFSSLCPPGMHLGLLGTPAGPSVAPSRRRAAARPEPADDVFGLGVLLLCAAFGLAPWDTTTEDYHNLLRLIRQLHDLDHETHGRMPPTLLTLASQCLDPAPSRRPSAAALVSTLRSIDGRVREESLHLALDAQGDMRQRSAPAQEPDAEAPAAPPDPPAHDAARRDRDVIPQVRAPSGAGLAPNGGFGTGGPPPAAGPAAAQGAGSGRRWGVFTSSAPVPLRPRTGPVPHSGLFIRRNNAFGTRSTKGIKDLIEQGVLIGQRLIRFDDFVADRSDKVPAPAPAEAIAVSHGLASAIAGCRASEQATHYLEIALRTPPAPEGHGLAAPPPLTLNVVFIVDISGSMTGGKLDTAKAAMLALHKQLRDDDIIGIVSFASKQGSESSAKTVLQAQRKTDLGAGTFAKAVREMTADGGTDLNQGVRWGITEAYRHAAGRQDLVNSLYLFSDGQPTSGVTDWIQIRKNVADAVHGNLTLSCFGFGADARMPELEALAGLTGGRCMLVKDPDDVTLNLTADVVRREQLAAIGIQLAIAISSDVRIWHFYGHDLSTAPAARDAVAQDADVAREQVEQTRGISAPDTGEGGIRVFVPDLAFSETYWIVLELAVPDALDLSRLGTATLDYVDVATRQPRYQVIALGTSRHLPEATVAAHAISLRTSEVAFFALDDLRSGDPATATQRLARHRDVLRTAEQHLGASQPTPFTSDEVALMQLGLLIENEGRPRAWDDQPSDAAALAVFETGDLARTRAGLNRDVDVPSVVQVNVTVAVGDGATATTSTSNRAVDGNVIQGIRDLQSAAASNAQAMRRLMALASTEIRCPRLFTVVRVQPQGLQKLKPHEHQFRLTLWCEDPDRPHPCTGGTYHFVQSADWVRKVSRYARPILALLRAAVPVVGVLAAAMPAKAQLEQASNELDRMQELLDEFPVLSEDGPDWTAAESTQLTPASGAYLREVHHLLRQIDGFETYGGLDWVQASSGEILWLCKEHKDAYKPDRPAIR